MKKQLTSPRVLFYVRPMPQRNIHRSHTAIDRLATADGLLQRRGVLSISIIALLALVLLITHGGAG